MKNKRWLILTIYGLLLAMFPMTIVVLHFIVLLILCLLTWVKILFFILLGVIKYGIFLGF